MTNEPEWEVARSLETTPDLLPFLPELLADVWALGCDPEDIVDVLRPLELEPDARVLDLGCGKGAVAIPLARELALDVEGVDLFEPFVAAAREKAREEGVAERCRFEVGDLRRALSRARALDVVVYASLGVLGDAASCVATLRRAVRPGGYMVLSDGFLAGTESLAEPGYEHYAGYDATLRGLRSRGDRVLSEVLSTAAEMEEYNRETNAGIRRRAEALCREHPEARRLIEAYVARQEKECEILETSFVGALWLLQRRTEE